MAEKENWEIKFQLIGLEIPMRVVSMDGLFYWEDEERFVAVSKLVRGRNLNQMNDVVDKRVVRDSLGSESLRLDRKLGVSGIQLDHVNIKETFSNGKRTLLVTDLCASIMKLREV